MITTKLQLVMSLISFGGLAFLLNQIVKYRLELKYTLLWLFLSVITILLAVFPRISFELARLLGIETPVNVIFLLGILLSLMIVFSLTVALSQHMVRIRQLSQELGICKNELAQLQRKVDQLTSHTDGTGLLPPKD
jgi:hypothetical protein